MPDSSETSQIVFNLASGQRLTACIRRSARARRASLHLAADGCLSLTLPAHWPLSAVNDCHERFLPWLERAWARHLRHSPPPGLPERIALPLSGQEYRVEQYAALDQGRHNSQQATQAMLCTRGVRRVLLLEMPGCLHLYGPHDETLAALALRRWCRVQATMLLPGHVQSLARTGGFMLEAVHIRDQRSRWGSCSRRAGNHANSGAGCIYLNWRAVLLPVPLLDHLIWHELCHLRQMNHSPAYRAELAQFSPRWSEQEKALGRFWRELPVWAISRA